MRLEQPQDYIHCGGFSAAGGAHKAHRAVRGNGEINTLKREMRGVRVTVSDLAQCDGLGERQRAEGAVLGIGGLQADQVLVQSIQRRAGKAQLGEGTVDLL